jgi:secondary thiamine-phosphate synthase enzyme
MKRFTLEFETRGNTDIINLSKMLADKHELLGGIGLVHLFAVGSTCAITTVEFEQGLVQHDLRQTLQNLVPDDAFYHHEATWNDDNGHSHLRAALVGPGVTLPFENGKLLTGDWQQVVFLDFDTRPRRRKVVVTVVS